jgi:ribosomal protein S18 acetylase RimI-like enzyme
MSAIPQPSSGVRIRRATVADAPIAGEIFFKAFEGISRAHNFPPDIPDLETGKFLMGHIFSSPTNYSVVAEIDGEVVGSNVIGEDNEIAGIGPITIRPDVQERDLGRMLMRAVMDHAAEGRFPGTRLVQAAFNMRSLSLYTKLGFEVREPLVCIQGTTPKKQVPGYFVRKANDGDAERCNELCRRVHGHTRAGDVLDALQEGSLRVCEREGKLTGYTTSIGFIGHSVGETNGDIIALVSTAEKIELAGMLVPMRNTEIFQWCLANGLRGTQPLTLMSVGLYNEPKGAWLPSILY